MNEKQKAAFLRSEGWKPYKVSDGTYGLDGWRDTKEKHVLESLAPLDMAYRIASRRRSQREARRLKAAGWRACSDDRRMWYLLAPALIHGADYKSKSEALQLLEAQG
jgi:hypothetical protein